MCCPGCAAPVIQIKKARSGGATGQKAYGIIVNAPYCRRGYHSLGQRQLQNAIVIGSLNVICIHVGNVEGALICGIGAFSADVGVLVFPITLAVVLSGMLC